jgi:hypothetical protein
MHLAFKVQENSLDCTHASVMLAALAFTRRLAVTRLPARSLLPISRFVVTGTGSGDKEESRKAARREYDRRYYEKNKDAIRQKNKLYYEENKDALSQKQKLYYEENKDAISQKSKLYYEENKDALSQYKELHREENKDAISQKDKLYYEENKDVELQNKKQVRDLKREKAIDSIRHRIAQSQHLLSGEEIDAVYHHFLHEEKYEIFQGQTLAQAIASGKWTFYFGVSKVEGFENKLSWLLPRGEKSNSPVLLMPDGNRIPRQFVKSQLGPEVVVLHSSGLVFNELALLWRLQEEYCHLPIGHRRLYRIVGRSNYREAEEIDDGDSRCKLYLNCFPVTSQDTSGDTVEINGIPLLINRGVYVIYD